MALADAGAAANGSAGVGGGVQVGGPSDPGWAEAQRRLTELPEGWVRRLELELGLRLGFGLGFPNPNANPNPNSNPYPDPKPNSNPNPFQVRTTHEAPSGQYKRFTGPSGERAQSLKQAWAIHDAPPGTACPSNPTPNP